MGPAHPTPHTHGWYIGRRSFIEVTSFASQDLLSCQPTHSYNWQCYLKTSQDRMRNARLNMIFNAEIVTWLLPVCVVGNFVRGIALKLWRWYGKVFGAPLWDHCLKAVCSLWNVSSLTQPSYFIGSEHSVATIHQVAFGVDTVATIHSEVRFGSSKLSWEMIEQVSLACSEHWPGLGNAEKKMKLLKWKLFRERNDKSECCSLRNVSSDT